MALVSLRLQAFVYISVAPVAPDAFGEAPQAFFAHRRGVLVQPARRHRVPPPPRRALLALYEPRTRYPNIPWTNVLVLLGLALLVASRCPALPPLPALPTLPTLPPAVVARLASWHGSAAALLGAWRAAAVAAVPPRLAAVMAAAAALPAAAICALATVTPQSAAFSAAALRFPDASFQAPATALLLLLLGRHVETTLGGVCLASACVFAGGLTAAVAGSSPGSVPLAVLCAPVCLYVTTSKAGLVTSVKHGEPLKGCISVTFWVNRWRVFKLIVLVQFVLTVALAPLVVAGRGAEARGALAVAAAAAVAGATLAFRLRRAFVKEKEDIDIKKTGTELLDVADKFLQNQEDQIGMALKAAEVMTDLAGGSGGEGGAEGRGEGGDKARAQARGKGPPSGLTPEDAKQLVGFAQQGLNFFKGLRTAAREKLDDGLDALASDTDENPRVAATYALAGLSLAASLAISRNPALAAAVGLQGGNIGSAALVARQLLATCFVHASWAQLSGAMLLLVVLGRAVEAQDGVGTSGLVVAYLAGGVSTGILAAAASRGGLQSWPVVPGLAAAGAVVGLLALSLRFTLAKTLTPQRPFRRLASRRELRRSLSRVDRNRVFEAFVLVYFVLAWLLASLPTDLPTPEGLQGAGWGLASRRVEAVASAAPVACPPCLLAVAGGLLGSAASGLLLFPLLGLACRLLKPVRVKWEKRQEAKRRAKEAVAKAAKENEGAKDDREEEEEE